jgi:gamma-glutamylcyclotransferase (GGCT)/AIG2-like uncharacterized protein YtfP
MGGLNEWWAEDGASVDLQESLAHMNRARRAELGKQDDVGICEALFNSLNKLWTAFRRASGAPGASDCSAFANMLRDIPAERAGWLCSGDALSHLVYLSPQVMNHDVLRRSEDYRPSEPVPPRRAREAQEGHRGLLNAYKRWRDDASHDNTTRLLKKLANLLYVVRSNIMHGEKTPYGPDLEKTRRDRQVCAVIRPLLWVLTDAVLDYPGRKLAVYGTLAPGEVNHGVLSHLRGMWDEAQVEGSLTTLKGLPAFQWRIRSGWVDIWILTSLDLEDYWARLDQFEGVMYRRIMVPVVFRSGGRAVGNIYEANES